MTCCNLCTIGVVSIVGPYKRKVDPITIATFASHAKDCESSCIPSITHILMIYQLICI